MRIGHGYDVHRLATNRDLVIGGVKIEYEAGLEGHSDADVLAHSIIDALLGAAGLGDIGSKFPDTDVEYKGISSMLLLEKTAEYLRSRGWTVSNIDTTIVAQKPKMSPYINQMAENIASALGVDAGRINVKATTEEGLGFTGAQQGIAAHAVALIKSVRQIRE